MHQKATFRIGFQTDQMMWKGHDYRCLKPESNLKPEDTQINEAAARYRDMLSAQEFCN